MTTPDLFQLHLLLLTTTAGAGGSGPLCFQPAGLCLCCSLFLRGGLVLQAHAAQLVHFAGTCMLLLMGSSEVTRYPFCLLGTCSGSGV